MNWKRRIQIDPKQNRRTMGVIVIVVGSCAVFVVLLLPAIYALACHLKGC